MPIYSHLGMSRIREKHDKKSVDHVPSQLISRDQCVRRTCLTCFVLLGFGEQLTGFGDQMTGYQDALGSFNDDTTHKYDNAICIIRTIIMLQLVVTNCFIVSGVIRHWDKSPSVNISNQV